MKNRSLEPTFRLVVGRVHHLYAEVQQESIEQGIGQVSHVVQEHIELVVPDRRVTVVVPQVHSFVQTDAPLQCSQS